jgi:TonB family protein
MRFNIESIKNLPEDQLIKYLFMISVGAHVVFFSVDQFSLFQDAEPLVAEWSIDTDLVMDSNVGVVQQSAIKDAKESEEAAVPKNMLPQLPKNFTIEKPTNPEDVVAEEVEREKEKPKDAPKEEKQTKEKIVNTLPEKKDTNTVAMKDALKRLALEKLKSEQKDTAKELTAQKNEDASRLKSPMLDKAGSMQGNSIGMSRQAKAYGMVLYRAIRSQYYLPETFKATDGKLEVTLSIRVNGQGHLDSIEVVQPSGDDAFDKYTIEAAKNAAPFEPPPESQIGRDIHIKFTL